MIISTAFSIRFALHRGGKRREVEMQVRAAETGLEDRRDEQKAARYVYEASPLAPTALTAESPTE